MGKSSVLVCVALAALIYMPSLKCLTSFEPSLIDPVSSLPMKINWNCFLNSTSKSSCSCGASQDVDLTIVDDTADKYLYCALQEVNKTALMQSMLTVTLSKTSPLEQIKTFIAGYNDSFYAADFSSLPTIVAKLLLLNFTAYEQSLNQSLVILANDLGTEIGPFKPHPYKLNYHGIIPERNASCSCKSGSLISMAISWPNMTWKESLALRDSEAFSALAAEATDMLWSVFQGASFLDTIVEFRVARFTRDKVLHVITVFQVGTNVSNLSNESSALLAETFPAFNLTFIQNSNAELATSCAWNATLGGLCSMRTFNATFPKYIRAAFANYTSTTGYPTAPMTMTTIPARNVITGTTPGFSTSVPPNKTSNLTQMWPSANNTVPSFATNSTISTTTLSYTTSTTNTTTTTTSPTTKATTLIVSNGTQSTVGGIGGMVSGNNTSMISSTSSTALLGNQTTTGSTVNNTTATISTSGLNTNTATHGSTVLTTPAARAGSTAVTNSTTSIVGTTLSNTNSSINKTEIKNAGIKLAEYVYYVTIPSFIGMLFLICCCLCCLQALYVWGRRDRNEEEDYKK